MHEGLHNPIGILICYSRSDENFQVLLKNFLEREDLFVKIFSVTIDDIKLENVVHKVKIALLLISPEFMLQNFVSSKQMQLLLEKHKERELRLIPVILRDVIWKNSPLFKLQALPRGDRAIMRWSNKQKAWLSIIKSIRLICEELQNPTRLSWGTHYQLTLPFEELPQNYYKLNKVFFRSGVPDDVTFVEPEYFLFLKFSLTDPGRGVVIEGPSGVGKTTAWEKAIQQLEEEGSLGNDLFKFNAWNPAHREELKTLQQWHNGIVIIDDFYRLDPPLRNEISDYLKYLADIGSISKKLVIVGSPQTGQTLVDTTFALATRIDVFKLGLVNDELVDSMIVAGEMALNIKFDRKADIVNAANGSLNVAQSLCFYICSLEKILETQDQPTIVRCDIDTAVSRVKDNFSRKFGKPIRQFAAKGGPKDSTCLKFLELLRDNDSGVLSLSLLKLTHPDLQSGIERFINEKWMDELYLVCPEIDNCLFFDRTTHELIVDDPQLTFYLRKTQFPELAEEVGKLPERIGNKVFISYSQKDVRWLERIQDHLKQIEREGIIDLWDDSKILAGAVWKEEMQKTIESARVAVVLVSQSFLASEFISEYQLPQILSSAAKSGTTIIPVILSPCSLYKSGLEKFKKLNTTSRTLSELSRPEQDRLLVLLAENIRISLRS